MAIPAIPGITFLPRWLCNLRHVVVNLMIRPGCSCPCWLICTPFSRKNERARRLTWKSGLSVDRRMALQDIHVPIPEPWNSKRGFAGVVKDLGVGVWFFLTRIYCWWDKLTGLFLSRKDTLFPKVAAVGNQMMKTEVISKKGGLK